MTLPTRPDGGIDWAKLAWLRVNDRLGEIGGMVDSDLRCLIARHERERIAQWHDKKALKFRGFLPNASGGDWPHYVGSAEAHEESAAAIRKMED